MKTGETKKRQGREGTPLDNDPNDPLTGGTRCSTSPGAGTICPGGPRGEERTTVEVGANRGRSGGGRWGSPTLNGQDNTGDATSLTPPLLLSVSLSSSAIAEEHVAGGAPSSADADLDAVPTDKDDVINVDDDGAMVVVVIAMLDTTGGNDAREAIVLALSSST